MADAGGRWREGARLGWNHRLRGRAFTLIELLVTLAVIAILAALLLPALAGAKSAAKSVVCGYHLKQWGQATHLYAADHADFLPKNGSSGGNSTADGWYVDLPKELGLPAYAEMPWRTNALIEPGNSVWLCPANSRRSNGKNLFHYCLNEHVNGTGAGNQIKLTTVAKPAATVWLFDNGKLAPVAQENNVHTNLHTGGAQFVFLDGHVARFRNVAYWNFATGKGLTNNPELAWFP